MNRHPGGEEQTLHLLEPIELRKGMKALDLGAGASVHFWSARISPKPSQNAGGY